MSRGEKLLITHKPAKLRGQVCWTNARHRSFAALRACPEWNEGMTKPRAVILSAAKDLSPTSGESPGKKNVPKGKAYTELISERPALFHSHETSHCGAWKRDGSLPVSFIPFALGSIASGSTTENVLPLPGLLSTSIRPPCSSTMYRER